MCETWNNFLCVLLCHIFNDNEVHTVHMQKSSTRQVKRCIYVPIPLLFITYGVQRPDLTNSECVSN